MFKSIQYLYSICIDTQKYEYLYKIIDDDFEEEVNVGQHATKRFWATVSDMDAFAVAVIKCYSQKSLGVIENLLKLVQYLHQEYRYSISTILSWWLKYVPEYQPYHEEIQKYLIIG